MKKSGDLGRTEAIGHGQAHQLAAGLADLALSAIALDPSFSSRFVSQPKEDALFVRTGSAFHISADSWDAISKVQA